MRTALIFAAVVVVIGLALYGEASMWQECLKDHSWLYCQRVLSK